MPLRATDQTIGAPSTPDLCWARQESGVLIGNCGQWPFCAGPWAVWPPGARAVELAAAPGSFYLDAHTPHPIITLESIFWSIRPRGKSANNWSRTLLGNER
jgi:hypothetical protein